MESIVQLISFFGINLLIWWALQRWGGLDQSLADQRAWRYLNLDEAVLLTLHSQYVDQLSKNQHRARCIKELEAIKKAIAMRHKIIGGSAVAVSNIQSNPL